MTDAKHTPGPWEKYGANNVVKGPMGNTVADVRYKNGHNDVHLIAAAPELLEALVNLLAYSESGEFINDDPEGSARATIAKAKGGDV